eukprot:3709395-Pleurochrysis_carterae.AAC.5
MCTRASTDLHHSSLLESGPLLVEAAFSSERACLRALYPKRRHAWGHSPCCSAEKLPCRACVSYKAELESYVEDQVLLVWDEEVNYGQRFYLVLTLKQRIIENETLLATAPVLAAALPSASLDVYLAHAWGRLETDKRCVALSQALEKREWKCWYDPHGHIRDDVDLPLATGIANTKVVILCLSAHAVETIRKGRLRDKAIKARRLDVRVDFLMRLHRQRDATLG